MNVFVLCTGRCGSHTFAVACKHLTNFTSARESLREAIHDARFAYPADHIEVDNRLSWLLGRLDEAYGRDAYYVHLQRDSSSVANSYNRRWAWWGSIVRAYTHGILTRENGGFEECLDFCHTVDSNIRLFLRDKPHTMEFELGRAKEDFVHFWEWIGGEGDLRSALAEWDVLHNATGSESRRILLGK